MRSRCSRNSRKANSDGFAATRNALGGIENIMLGPTPEKRRLSEAVGESWPLSAVKPSKSSKLPVPVSDISPIESRGTPIARSRKRLEGGTPARVVTSTPAGVVHSRSAKRFAGGTPAQQVVTHTPVAHQSHTRRGGSAQVVASTPARSEPRPAKRPEGEGNTPAPVATSTPASARHRLPKTLDGDTPAQVVTSTPASAQSLPNRPGAVLGEQLSRMSVGPGETSNPSPCLFDSAMAAPETSLLRPSLRRRASPELSVQRVSRTYTRTSKSPGPVRVHLFTEPGSSSEDEEAGGLREKPMGAKRQAKKAGTAGPKKGKQERADPAFEQWAKNMAAEFDEIEEYELCIV